MRTLSVNVAQTGVIAPRGIERVIGTVIATGVIETETGRGIGRGIIVIEVIEKGTATGIEKEIEIGGGTMMMRPRKKERNEDARGVKGRRRGKLLAVGAVKAGTRRGRGDIASVMVVTGSEIGLVRVIDRTGAGMLLAREQSGRSARAEKRRKQRGRRGIGR
jgi:hypothetical protein